jgi:hypothetical protein
MKSCVSKWMKTGWSVQDPLGDDQRKINERATVTAHGEAGKKEREKVF